MQSIQDNIRPIYEFRFECEDPLEAQKRVDKEGNGHTDGRYYVRRTDEIDADQKGVAIENLAELGREDPECVVRLEGYQT